MNLGEDKEMETMACKNPKMQTKEHLQDFSFKGPLSHFVLISKKQNLQAFLNLDSNYLSFHKLTQLNNKPVNYYH